MSTKTTHFNLHKPELTDLAKIDANNENWDIIDAKLKEHDDALKQAVEDSGNGIGGIPITNAYTTDGKKYSCTIENMDEIVNGTQIIIIPNAMNTNASPTLVVNGGETLNVVLRSTTGQLEQTASVGWLIAEQPVLLTRVTNSVNNVWCCEGLVAVNLSENTVGVLPIEHGGTGATKANQARINLNAAPQYLYGTTDLEAGVTPLEDGILYFYYQQ